MKRNSIKSLEGKTIRQIEIDDRGYVILKDRNGKAFLTAHRDRVYDGDGNFLEYDDE